MKRRQDRSQMLQGPDYFERISEEFQGIREVAEFVEANRNLFSDDLLAQITQDFERSATPQIDNLISIAFRIEQIAIRFLGNTETPEQYRPQAKIAFELAAKLFEQIAEAQVINSQFVNIDLYLHSAIDFSLGEYQANSTVIAKKVLEKFDFGDDIHSIILNAVFLLLKRDLLNLDNKFSITIENKKSFEGVYQQKLEERQIDEFSAVEDLASFLALEAIHRFSIYLRFGNNADFDFARSKIDASLSLFNAIRDSDNYILSQLIGLLIRQMQFSSLWNQLGKLGGFLGNPILRRYIHILTTDRQKPIYELWNSQVEALPSMLSAKDSAALQMPTSAGKTRIAEIKIIQTLALGEQGTKCIYVAPYKSLAVQVEETLSYYLSKVGFRVTSIFGSYESIDFEDMLAENSDVLVITPEKLDYLFRQNKGFFEQVKLIVIDEGHLIDNGVRGLRLEMLLNRLSRSLAKNNLQILFISAVVPNIIEIATWLTQGSPNLIGSKWKPTKLRQGIYYWNNKWEGMIRYPEERIILNTGIERRLIQEFHKTRPGVRLKNPIYYPETVYDIAIELALLFKKSSPTIIFTAVRNHVDSIAKRLHTRILEEKTRNPEFSLVPENKAEKLEELAKTIERRMGVGFQLATYIREGFAFHHGLLPDDLRTSIEIAFRSENLRFLIATPTLAQGVNLPVHLMIVANLERGDATPFLVRDFRNIAGRSGRALHETEGYVIFIQKAQEFYLDPQRYSYLKDDRMESVESVLMKLYRQLVNYKLGISLEQFLKGSGDLSIEDSDINLEGELNSTFQTQILAMLYEELINESDPDSVRVAIDNSLFGYQWKVDRKYYKPLIDFGQKQVKFLNTQFKSPEQRNAYYRTGFSIRSCVELEEAIRELAKADVFSTLRSADGKLDSDKLTKILSLIDIPSETSQKYKANESIIKAMIDWINFGEIAALAETYKTEDALFENLLNVSDLIYRFFMNDSPWSLNAISRILNYLHEVEELAVSSEINLLSGYVKYGVNNPVSAYLCGLGVTDRITARTIADHYYKEMSPKILLPNLSDLIEWLQDLTVDDLRTLLSEEQLIIPVWSAIQKTRVDIRPFDFLAKSDDQDILTYVVGLKYEGRLNHIPQLKVGDKLTLLREQDNLVDPYAIAVHMANGVKLGFIRSSKAFYLSTLIDQGQQTECTIEKINPPAFHPNRRLLVNIKIRYTNVN